MRSIVEVIPWLSGHGSVNGVKVDHGNGDNMSSSKLITLTISVVTRTKRSQMR